MLPHKDLARFYEKVSWLYVCRTFDKKPRKDREALRTHDRFGISSWPQMFLFDPRDDRELESPPRDLSGFVRTFDRVLAAWQPPTPRRLKAGRAIAARLRAARKLLESGDEDRGLEALSRIYRQKDEFEGWLEALELEREYFATQSTDAPDPLYNPDPRVRALRLEELAKNLPTIPVSAEEKSTAIELLRDQTQDIVVRIRALRLLRALAPGEIAASVPAFLKVANDQWRYEVLALAKDRPSPSFTAPILRLIDDVATKVPSRNPNVVRIRALGSLARCGNESALGPVIEMMRGPLNNSLTRLAPRSLAAIGQRIATLRPRITSALLDALPAPIQDASTKQGAFDERLATAMAREIAGALGRLANRPAPTVGRAWTAGERRQLEKRLAALIRVR